MWKTLKTFLLHKKGAGRALTALLAILGLSIFLVTKSHQARIVDPPKVLILAPTVTGGASSREAQAATALGYTVEVVDNAGWAAKTQAEFGTYRALILGDATCTNVGVITAAVANKDVWGPVVNGNVIIIGTDPVFHNGQGGQQLTEGGVKFAADKEGKTGMYITLSCYYHGTAPMTPVPRRRRDQVVRPLADRALPARAHAPDQLLLGSREAHRHVQRLTALPEHRLQRLGLRDRAGVSVQDEARRRIRHAAALPHQRVHHVIADQLAGVHQPLRLDPQLGLAANDRQRRP